MPIIETSRIETPSMATMTHEAIRGEARVVPRYTTIAGIPVPDNATDPKIMKTYVYLVTNGQTAGGTVHFTRLGLSKACCEALGIEVEIDVNPNCSLLGGDEQPEKVSNPNIIDWANVAQLKNVPTLGTSLFLDLDDPFFVMDPYPAEYIIRRQRTGPAGIPDVSQIVTHIFNLNLSGRHAYHYHMRGFRRGMA